MVRTALVALTALSLAVVLAAAGAIVQGSQPLPHTTTQVAFADTLAASPQTTTVHAAGAAPAAEATDGEATADDAEPAGFTIGELADGEVSAERFTAFWDGALERIRTAPCAAPSAPGTTVVVADVGATPPSHLGDAYPDYAPLLAEARAEAAAGC